MGKIYKYLDLAWIPEYYSTGDKSIARGWEIATKYLTEYIHHALGEVMSLFWWKTELHENICTSIPSAILNKTQKNRVQDRSIGCS
jgi:hypothetical protein